jgi:hypothetical protein
MKYWNEYIIEQKTVCSRYGSHWMSLDPELRIGIADNVFNDVIPINGLRHPQEFNTSGWYVWAGSDFSESKDFFKPYCIKHLLEIKPELIKYLGLPPGYRFQIDNKGYEDVWEDKTLIY